MKLLLALLLLAALAHGGDSWLGADKALHLGGAVASTTGFYSLARACRVEHRPATWLAVGVTAGLCVGKELVDDKASWRDLAVDAVGVTLAVVAITKWSRTR